MIIKITIMTTYKGFKIYKIKNTYFVSSGKDGQIAPNDNCNPTTIKECQEFINNYKKLKS